MIETKSNRLLGEYAADAHQQSGQRTAVDDSPPRRLKSKAG